jgi:hypothetical protein
MKQTFSALHTPHNNKNLKKKKQMGWGVDAHIPERRRSDIFDLGVFLLGEVS